jgi:hypothetical protein
MSRFPDTPEDVVEAEALPDEQPVSGTSSFSGRLPLAGAIILAVVAEAFLGAALALTGGSHLSLVEVGVPIISGFFALGACLLAGLLLRGRERGAWTLMGLACLGVLVAQGAQFLPASLVSGLALSGSYPSVASVALIAQNALLFLAFLLFPAPATERATLRGLRQFFDGVLVVGSALIGAGYFILLPLSQEQNITSTPIGLTALAICVADGLLLAGVLFALRSPTGGGNPLGGALRLLALGALLLIAADAVSLIRHPAQPSLAYSWLQLVWNAGYLFLGLGAILRLRGESRSDLAEDAAHLVAAQRPSLWLTAPFALTVVVAGAIMLRALMGGMTAAQMLTAIAFVSLLVALIGARHLVGVFEAHRLGVEKSRLSHEAALLAQEMDRLQEGLIAESQQRQEAVAHLQDILTHVSYGAYHMRAEALDADLVPLVGALNMLLEGLEQQRTDRDRLREARLIRTLADALGRLALGELHDLPSLPAPAGSGGIDDLIRGAIQVRSRLVTLQEQSQRYETERLELEQQMIVMRHQMEEEEQARIQVAAEANQAAEDHWQVEYQVAQATQDQLRRDLQRTQERQRAAEEQAQAADAALQALEAKARQERLAWERERMDIEERLRAEREALEQLRQQAPAQPAAFPTERLREQGGHLARQLGSQAERLHIAAASLQTAAEVAQRLSRTLEETAASPDLRAPAPVAAPASEPQTAPAVTKQLSAMQMLEKLAGLRTGDTAPQPVVTPATSIPPSSGKQSGPMGEAPGERVARRLQGAAGRAEEIATGLLELAQQFIATGEETARTAEEANHLVAELEPVVPVASIIPKTTLPPRQPKSRR